MCDVRPRGDINVYVDWTDSFRALLWTWRNAVIVSARSYAKRHGEWSRHGQSQAVSVRGHQSVEGWRRRQDGPLHSLRNDNYQAYNEQRRPTGTEYIQSSKSHLFVRKL